MHTHNLLFYLTRVTIAFTFLVIVLGTYTRLSNAGLRGAIANIIMFVPISVAVMHNAVAPLLLASAGALLFHTKYSRH